MIERPTVDPQWLAKKRSKRFETIDAMSPALRDVVNDYGSTVVQTLQHRGITEPRLIRHVVEAILDELSPTRTPRSHQGPRAVQRQTPT